MLRKTLMSLVVGLTVLSTMSFASVTDLQTSVKVTGEKSFALYLIGLSNNVQIVIKDQEGHTLYKEQVNDQDTFAKNFNLMKLQEGDYTLKIEDGSQIKSFEMDIEGNKISFQDEVVTYKPSTSISESKVMVAMDAMNGSELNVSIKDSHDELVFEEVVAENDKGLNRIYDLSKIQGGEYTFIFNSNGHTFIHPVNIRK